MSCPTDVHAVLKVKPDVDKEVRVHIDCLKPYAAGVPKSWNVYEQTLLVQPDNDGMSESDTDIIDESEPLGDVMFPIAELPDSSVVDLMRDEIVDDEDTDDTEAVMSDDDNDEMVTYGRGQRVCKPPVRYSPE